MYQINMQATNFNQCSMSEVTFLFILCHIYLLTCLLTLTFAYKYATMLILGGTELADQTTDVNTEHYQYTG